MRKKTVLTCVLVLLSSAILTGCGAKKEIEEDISSEVPLFEDERDEITYVSVETPYGELKFQERWEEAIFTEQTEDGDNLIVSFKTKINDETYSLFDLTIGELDEEPAAEITDSDGNLKNIYVTMHEVIPGQNLSEEDLDQIYAMQEEINSILSFLE